MCGSRGCVARIELGCRILAGVLLLGLSGCGDAPAGGKERQRASASGKATFDGQPIASGGVLFQHAESGRPYIALTNEKGDFTVDKPTSARNRWVVGTTLP